MQTKLKQEQKIMMPWIYRTLRLLFPAILLEGSPWHREWREQQRQRFIKTARIFFLIVGVAYLSHYFFFDKPRNLQPQSGWLLFRFSAFLICLACSAYYSSRFSAFRWYRVPALVACAAACYSQAHVTVVYPDAPWTYPFVFVFACVLILQMTALQSLAYASATIALLYSPLRQAGLDTDTLVSATIVTVILSSAVRSGYAFEVNSFLLQKEKDQQRREIIALQQDFTDRLRSFIPKVIANRIVSLVDHERMTVLEASIAVLAPRKAQVACLFSDIRGFTQGSKDLDGFLLDSVIPEIKASTDAIEQYEGIPRKIGDLVFAYFDAQSTLLNLIRAALAGISIAQTNEDMNATMASISVKRHILISSGPAIVGNLGGADSSVEITALGPPVNFLSRLDEATKNPRLATELSPNDILLCPSTATQLLTLEIGITCREIQLDTLGVEIRDFPEVKRIFAFRASDSNMNALTGMCSEALDPLARPRSSHAA